MVADFPQPRATLQRRSRAYAVAAPSGCARTWAKLSEAARRPDRTSAILRCVPRLRIVSHPEAQVPPALRRQVVRLQDLAWPPPAASPTPPAPWHDVRLRPLSVLLLDGDRVVSALDILSTEIRHAGLAFAVSGISAMVTDPQARSRGHGRRLAAAARDLMRVSGVDLGVFTCDRELQPFYASAGWTPLPGSVLIGGTPVQPFPSDRLDKVVMASFFSPRAMAAASSFVGARIELYPGLIDKLW